MTGNILDPIEIDEMTKSLIGPQKNGVRRIDRVLDPEYTSGLSQLSMEELRVRRREAEQEEAELSFIRRILQGRIDLAQHELEHRNSASSERPRDDQNLVSTLVEVLADHHTPDAAPTLQQRAHEVVPRIGESAVRTVEILVNNAGLSNITALTPETLAAAIRTLTAYERAVSLVRKATHSVLDKLAAEIGRRYTDGVSD